MNIKEYLNQKDPIRMPKVVLTKKDYKKGSTIKLMGGRETRTQIFINAYPGVEYVQVNDNPCLKTTDSDGNPKSSSCFYI